MPDDQHPMQQAMFTPAPLPPPADAPAQRARKDHIKAFLDVLPADAKDLRLMVYRIESGQPQGRRVGYILQSELKENAVNTRDAQAAYICDRWGPGNYKLVPSDHDGLPLKSMDASPYTLTAGDPHAAPAAPSSAEAKPGIVEVLNAIKAAATPAVAAAPSAAEGLIITFLTEQIKGLQAQVTQLVTARSTAPAGDPSSVMAMMTPMFTGMAEMQKLSMESQMAAMRRMGKMLGGDDDDEKSLTKTIWQSVGEGAVRVLTDKKPAPAPTARPQARIAAPSAARPAAAAPAIVRLLKILHNWKTGRLTSPEPQIIAGLVKTARSDRALAQAIAANDEGALIGLAEPALANLPALTNWTLAEMDWVRQVAHDHIRPHLAAPVAAAPAPAKQLFAAGASRR